jgi:hypothetical protein
MQLTETNPIASLQMWSAIIDGRHCFVHVFGNDYCRVDLHAHGELVFRRDCESLEAAMSTAEGLRRIHESCAPREDVGESYAA